VDTTHLSTQLVLFHPINTHLSSTTTQHSMSDPTDPAANGSSSPPSGVASSLSLQPQTQAPVQPMWVTDVLSQLDVDAFDWTAFEGTYKGASVCNLLPCFGRCTD
jgi:hypothetical protein